MTARPALRLLGILVLVVSFAYPTMTLAEDASPAAMTTAEVVASGLTTPRGFPWGDDGTIYLGLAGTGGDQQLAVEATPLPFFVSDTASIATVADGCTPPVAENLPSLFWNEPGWTWGIMDVVILNGELYALSGGGSTPEEPNGIYRVLEDGSRELVADLAAWSSENPTSFLPPDDDPAAGPVSLTGILGAPATCSMG